MLVVDEVTVIVTVDVKNDVWVMLARLVENSVVVNVNVLGTVVVKDEVAVDV